MNIDTELAQFAALIAVGIVSAFVGIWKYLRTQSDKTVKPATATTDTGAVLAASFIDSRTLRELIDTLRMHMEEYSRETRKMNRNRQELTTALEESTDATLANTDASINMLKFIKRIQSQRAADEKINTPS
jgi:t-SNARE complex subunit (syntaxin)